MITGFLLKPCAESVISVHRVNEDRYFASWANIVPVHKKGNKWDYRLHLLLDMERIVHSQLTSCLEAYGHIIHHQYGFRRHCSTIHVLLEATNDWAYTLELCQSCHCLFLDFSKVFDTASFMLIIKVGKSKQSFQVEGLKMLEVIPLNHQAYTSCTLYQSPHSWGLCTAILKCRHGCLEASYYKHCCLCSSYVMQ